MYTALVGPTAAEKFCTMHLSILVQRKNFVPCSSKILLHGTKFFRCTSFFSAALTCSHYISRMQCTNHLLHDSHSDQEGTKGPLTGKALFGRMFFWTCTYENNHFPFGFSIFITYFQEKIKHVQLSFSNYHNSHSALNRLF